MTANTQNPDQPGRLLLVDDNPTNLKVLNETLQGRGYEMRIARSGEQALTVADKSRPDLILLDIQMPPGIDGYETIRRLKQNPKTGEVPVIFLSALGDTQDKVKGLGLGAVDYISKPFQADEVIARVNTHLTMHRLRQELGMRNRELELVNGRMSKDLEAAARIQHALLPGSLPDVEGMRFAWQYHPCDELAGDALNIHRVDDRHVLLYVVDVSSHGVPAALLSVTIARALTPSADPSCLVTSGDEVVSPAEVAQRLNRLYPMEANGNHYFTMIYGLLDLETGRFQFVLAGHPGPLRIRRGAAREQTKAPALPIGLFPESKYVDSEIRLEPGDRLFLFSDGLYEESNAEEVEFGIVRLGQALSDRLDLSLEQSIEALRQDVIAWRGDDRFGDDISILAVEMLTR